MDISSLDISEDISERLKNILVKNIEKRKQNSIDPPDTSPTNHNILPPQPAPRRKETIQDNTKTNEGHTETDQDKSIQSSDARVSQQANLMEDLFSEPNLLPSASPWRTHKEPDPWGEETKKQLRNEIVTHELTEEAGIDNINVLLVGEIAAGKSSFFNSVESLFDGHVTSRANAGHKEKSLTTQYRQYFVSNGEAKDGRKKKIKFRFCDSMGLEGGANGLIATDLAKIMDGHVENLAELNEGKFMPGSPGYKTQPTDNDQIHCVAIIMNAQTITAMDEEIVQKIKDIREEADGRHLFPLIILTRIDELCPDTDEKTSNVFHSQIIRDKVNEVSEMFGIKENQIQPVRNYNSQTECEQDMDILTLRALRQILRYSQTYLKDKLEREEEQSKLLDQKVADREKKRRNPWTIREKELKRDDGERVNADNVQKEKVTATISVDPAEKNTKKWTACKDHDCKGAPGQISLKQDEEVDEVEEAGKGWTIVRNKEGEKGAVPSDILVDSTNPSARKLKAVQVYDCKGAPGQIDLQQGEEVDEVIPDIEGWTKIRNSRGQAGTVPTNVLVDPAHKTMKNWRAKLYSAKGAPGQINLVEGETVDEITPACEGWITVRNRHGEKGSVPAEFLAEPAQKTMKKWIAKLYSAKGAPGQINLVEGETVDEIMPACEGWITVRNRHGGKGAVPEEFLVDPAQKTMKKWIAKLYSSKGAPGQINLVEGETVDEITPACEGWITVRNSHGEKGSVPAEFLMSESACTQPQYPGDSQISEKKKWKATFPYDSGGCDGFLNLVVGEQLEEVEPDHEGWTMLRKLTGEEGMAPTNHLEQL